MIVRACVLPPKETSSLLLLPEEETSNSFRPSGSVTIFPLFRNSPCQVLFFSFLVLHRGSSYSRIVLPLNSSRLRSTFPPSFPLPLQVALHRSACETPGISLCLSCPPSSRVTSACSASFPVNSSPCFVPVFCEKNWPT